MRSRVAIGVAAAVLFGTAALHAAELKSGKQVGAFLTPFQVVKQGGAPNDKVKVGQELCYVWRLGKRPVVLIFAKEQGDALASLVKQIDAVVAKNAEKAMASVVNFIGEDRDELEESAAKFGKSYKNVAIVVPVEFGAGPKNYGINPDAGVTVLIYTGAKVVVNHAILPGKLSKSKIAEIVKDTSKILE